MSQEHYFTPQPTSGAHDEHIITLRRELPSGTRELRFASGGGVFSKAHLDDGSALLLETFLAHAKLDNSRVLDLGCGWGALGCCIAAHEPACRVAMCDINTRAAQWAQSNAARNDLTNISTWCGDGASAARESVFAFALCNPPVRAGNAVIAKLFNDAHRCLKSGGELWLVLRTAQGAKSWQRRLESDWGNCQTRALHSGFRILCSTKT